MGVSCTQCWNGEYLLSEHFYILSVSKRFLDRKFGNDIPYIQRSAGVKEWLKCLVNCSLRMLALTASSWTRWESVAHSIGMEAIFLVSTSIFYQSPEGLWIRNLDRRFASS